jgi:hypothetical protein
MYNFNTSLTLQENDTALQYSEDTESLKSLMQEVTVNIKTIGDTLYFQDDKKPRHTLSVTIKRNNKQISFKFGMSIYDTEILSKFQINATDNKTFGMSFKYDTEELNTKLKEIKSGMLYSILCCVKTDYSCPSEFKDFCTDYGYDEDSRKAEKTFRECIIQANKLHRIFTDDEIECLPS